MRVRRNSTLTGQHVITCTEQDRVITVNVSDTLSIEIYPYTYTSAREPVAYLISTSEDGAREGVTRCVWPVPNLEVIR